MLLESFVKECAYSEIMTRVSLGMVGVLNRNPGLSFVRDRVTSVYRISPLRANPMAEVRSVDFDLPCTLTRTGLKTNGYPDFAVQYTNYCTFDRLWSIGENCPVHANRFFRA